MFIPDLVPLWIGRLWWCR